MDARTYAGRRTIGNAARGLAAASVLLSAVVHLDLWTLGLSAHPVLGPGFMATFVGGLVVAVALLVWDHWLPVLAAIGFGAATLAAYVMALTVGFLGVQEAGGGTPAVLSLVSESAAVVLGLVALVAERGVRRRSADDASPARTRAAGLTPPRPARP
ncbi:hypothetical protein ICW40_08360 [Actinotalea ferrariae]|uniref:hypothetical protein n=1 Tax=Actinotalea ferrariae TaxID=1386098 RepID=UPI001C8CE587|nr:hypothetical protein [Actinotalea ferrariae]MBX9244822.1 hypothetical protein [Actinotalea ferrariae]